MIDFIFGFFGLFIRLAFVYKFDLKKMNANNSPEESHKKYNCRITFDNYRHYYRSYSVFYRKIKNSSLNI